MRCRLRAQQITIDVPRTSTVPWVNIVVQRITIDGDDNDIMVEDRWNFVNKKIADVALDTVSFSKLEGFPDSLITVADVATSIELLVGKWIAAEFGATINEAGLIIKEF